MIVDWLSFGCGIVFTCTFELVACILVWAFLEWSNKKFEREDHQFPYIEEER